MGKRLRPESLAVKVNGMSIADFTAMPVSRALEVARKASSWRTRGEDCRPRHARMVERCSS
jgi:excinuclease UvrABC ATPase subunit